MAELRPRIVGTEMEWPVSGRLAGAREFRQVEGLGEVTRAYLHPDMTTVSTMLSNGGRFYLDVGEHIEYATPEDASLRGAVVGEFAGERVVIDALSRFFRDKEKFAEMKLNKRVIDERGVTWGYHVNLSADREAVRSTTDDDLHLLGLHLATSLPLLGSGAIVKSGWQDGQTAYGYRFGQKINDVQYDYTHGTMYQDKGLINQRDEPLMDRERFRRIHLTSMDPHISPWATWMALGSCSLILRAIEQRRGRTIRLTDTGSQSEPLLMLAQANNKDMTLRATKAKIGGKTMRQLDIQNVLLELARQTEHTDEEAAVLDEWQHAVDDLETNPQLLIGRSDAIAKRNLIERQADKQGEDPADFGRLAAQRIDRQYDTLVHMRRDGDGHVIETDPGKLYDASFAAKLRSSSFKRHHPHKATVTKRILAPPANSRAYRRGRAIASDTVQSATWQHYTDTDGTRHDLNDPYRRK